MPRLLADVLATGTLAERDQPVLDAGAAGMLRPWTAHDVPAVVAAYADPDIQHWHHRSWSPSEAAAWIEASHRAWRDETGAEWAVEHHGDVVARIAVHEVSLMIGQAEVSYWTVPAARGRGVATTSLGVAAGWLLDEVGFWRLEVRHSTRNRASCRVATAAGFVHEATLRRQHLHADGWHDVHVHSRHREAPPREVDA